MTGIKKEARVIITCSIKTFKPIKIAIKIVH